MIISIYTSRSRYEEETTYTFEKPHNRTPFKCFGKFYTDFTFYILYIIYMV